MNEEQFHQILALVKEQEDRVSDASPRKKAREQAKLDGMVEVLRIIRS